MNTLYYKHEITPVFFFSQPPQQQSYTKDPQGGVWRPGKPQISVSCPRVEFVLLWSSSARSWDDVAVSLLCHSLFSQHKGGMEGGGSMMKRVLKQRALTVKVEDSWCCQTAYSAKMYQCSVWKTHQWKVSLCLIPCTYVSGSLDLEAELGTDIWGVCSLSLC